VESHVRRDDELGHLVHILPKSVFYARLPSVASLVRLASVG